MREILFRGKRIRTGQWVEGMLNKWTSAATKEEVYAIITQESVEVVDPETVGQYTGLTDKNGVKIFEGDRFITVLGEMYVCYNADTASFGIKKIGVNGFWSTSPGRWHDDIEIIGNIHDNPELLK